MKQTATLLFIILTLAFALSACSRSESNAGTNEPAGAGAVSDGQRLITDSKGQQSVPEHPEKIAVTYFALTELLLALDKPPAAANYFDDFVSKFVALQPYYSDSKIIDIGSYNEINLEKLLDLGPDLILAAGSSNDLSSNDHIYDKLTQIAPVVYLDAAKFNADWKWGLTEIGKALGLEQKADEVIANYENKIQESKDKLNKFKDQSVLFIDLQDKDFYLWGTERMADYYGGIGLTKPDLFNGESQSVSLEGLSELNPDHIFLHKRSDAALEPMLKEWEKSTVWNQLEAVKNGRVYELDSSAFSPGPIGTVYGIDSIIASMDK